MHEGHRERLRRRYREHGPEALEDHELLELLLCYAIPRRDVNPLSHRILDNFGSLGSLFGAPVNTIRETEGVGESSAILIHLVGAIGKRAHRQGIASRQPLNTRESAGAYLQTLLAGRHTEAFYALFLDNQSRLIRAECISEGDHSEARVNPRDVVSKALLYGAASVILGHNHPGGSCKPSTADIHLTEKLKDVLQSLNINCPEHYIIADDQIYAMEMRQVLPSAEAEGPSLGQRQTVGREGNGVTDPYELAKILKSLDVSQLDIVLAELE